MWTRFIIIITRNLSININVDTKHWCCWLSNWVKSVRTHVSQSPMSAVESEYNLRAATSQNADKPIWTSDWGLREKRSAIHWRTCSLPARTYVQVDDIAHQKDKYDPKKQEVLFSSSRIPALQIKSESDTDEHVWILNMYIYIYMEAVFHTNEPLAEGTEVRQH